SLSGDGEGGPADDPGLGDRAGHREESTLRSCRGPVGADLTICKTQFKVLPLRSPGRSRPDTPRPGSGNRVTDGDAPRRRTGSRPSGPTPSREHAHNL